MFSEEILSQLELRGVVAFAARCTRRVFPLLGCFEKAKDFNAAIALAEEFARGRTVYPTQARDIAASVVDPNTYRSDSGEPAEPWRNTWYAIKSIDYLGQAAASAFSAVTNIPPKSDCSEQAFNHAKEAVKAVNESILATDSYWYRSEAEWAKEAMQQDLENLKNSHSGSYEELGISIDPGKDGLGSLWLEKKIPEWYREQVEKLYTIRKFNVQNFDENTLIQLKLGTFPDIICWKITSNPAESEMIIEEMKAVQRVCRTIDRPPPALVVFAPNLEEAKRRKLIIQGATVYTNSAQEKGLPYDAESLREQLEASYVGWVEDKEQPGMWTYYDGFQTEAVKRPKEKKVQESSPKTQETVTEEHYKLLIDDLQADPWWSMEY